MSTVGLLFPVNRNRGASEDPSLINPLDDLGLINVPVEVFTTGDFIIPELN